MGDFASKGVAGAGLGTGIAGLSLGVLNSMGGLFGGCGRNNGWGWNNGWNNGCGCGYGDGYGYNNGRWDVQVSEALAERDAAIAQLRSEKYADSVGLDIYKYFDGQLKDIRQQMCDQAVFNEKMSGTISVVANQIAALQVLTNSITKTAIPESAICDFNGRGCCGNTVQ